MISNCQNPLKIKFQNLSQGIIVQKLLQKMNEAHFVCHLAGLAHKMDTLLRSFQAIFFCSKLADALFNDRQSGR